MDELEKQSVLTALNSCDEVRVRIGGWSMWPFLQNQDILVIRKSLPVTIGRIAVVFAENQMIAHRIIWISKDQSGITWTWIQGDFCPFGPAKIRTNEIAGVAAYCLRSGKTRELWLRGPLALAAIPLSRIIRKLYEIFSFFQVK